jgi:hypothetical protein
MNEKTEYGRIGALMEGKSAWNYSLLQWGQIGGLQFDYSPRQNDNGQRNFGGTA